MENTFRKAGYKCIKNMGGGNYIMETPNKVLEVWTYKTNGNKNGMKFKNTHLYYWGSYDNWNTAEIEHTHTGIGRQE